MCFILWRISPLCFLQALHVIQPLVVPVFGYQLLVRAVFHDFALVHDVDFVRVADGAQAVGDGDGGARLHQALQGFLHQAFALRVEGGGGFVQDEDGRVLQDGAGDADALALPAGQASAAVAYHRVVALLRLHDEIVGVGNLGRFDDLLHGSVLHAEGDVVVEGVVEEDGFLVDVADEGAQAVDGDVLHVLAVDEQPAFGNVVVARHEVHQRGLARAGLPHQGDGLALGHGEVDVLQHGASLDVAEADAAELDLVFKARQGQGDGGLLDGVLRLQDHVDAVHAGQADWHVVESLGKFLQRVDDAVEHHHIINKHRGVHRRVVRVEDERAAEPQDDDDDTRAQELAHGVCRALADDHGVDRVAVFLVDFAKTVGHLPLCQEGLDDAQAAQRLVQLRHDAAPLRLHRGRAALQLAGDGAHAPARQGQDDDDEQRHLPAEGEHDEEVDQYGDGVAQQHVHRAGDVGLHGGDVGAHAGDDVALALFGEEAQREAQHLAVDLQPDVAHHARAQRHHHGGRGEVARRLQQGQHDEQAAQHQQHLQGAVFVDEVAHPPVGVVHQRILGRAHAAPVHGLVLVRLAVHLEQDVQDGHKGHEGEHVEPLRHEVQDDSPCQVLAVGPDVAAQQGEELFQHRESR